MYNLVFLAVYIITQVSVFYSFLSALVLSFHFFFVSVVALVEGGAFKYLILLSC